MKNNRIVVPCDSCKKRFVVRKPKKKIHNDGIEGRLTIYYIQCTNCKEKFVSFVESKKIKTMIKENKQLQNRLRTIKDDAEYVQALDEFEKNTSRIDTVKKDLIFRFSKYV